jgi:hypothetical protein
MERAPQTRFHEVLYGLALTNINVVILLWLQKQWLQSQKVNSIITSHKVMIFLYGISTDHGGRAV